MDTSRQYFVDIGIDETSKDNLPIIDALQSGEEYSIITISLGCYKVRSTIFIRKENDKFYARLNYGKEKKLSFENIEMIRSFEEELYRTEDRDQVAISMSTSYFIQFKNKLYYRNNYLKIQLRDLKLK